MPHKRKVAKTNKRIPLRGTPNRSPVRKPRKRPVRRVKRGTSLKKIRF